MCHSTNMESQYNSHLKEEEKSRWCSVLKIISTNQRKNEKRLEIGPYFNYPMGMGKPMFVLELSTGEFWILNHQNIGVSKSRKKNMILKSAWIDQKYISKGQLRSSKICSDVPKSCKEELLSLISEEFERKTHWL